MVGQRRTMIAKLLNTIKRFEDRQDPNFENLGFVWGIFVNGF